MSVQYISFKKGTPAKGYWDQEFLDDILKTLVQPQRTVVVIPGAYQADVIDKINEYINQFEKVLIFVTSDEEGKFPCHLLKHPDMKIYCQYGTCQNKHVFPIGYTTETRKRLKQIGLKEKDIDVFFAGQLNSDERKSLFSRLAFVKKAVLFGTDGFSRGLKPQEYYEYLASTKFAPSPGGHVSPDSFRFYEALEAGCIPITYPPYMKKLFPNMPEVDAQWTQDQANHIFAWWIKTKMLIRQQIKEEAEDSEALTIIIPTSPIKSHPSTEIIDQTIASIRHHTSMDIILTIDGVRPEQEHMRNDYTEYIRRLLWKCNFEYENVMPLIFDKHVHQSGMIKEALQYVKTPLVMYVEHDTPLTTDRKIDWKYISHMLLDQKVNCVRFHYEEFVPEPHIPLMLPEKDLPYLLATRQWSQRPHITRTSFYKRAMQYFSPNANCFIEDLLYGKCVEGDWNQWKLFIYNPEQNGHGLKRSLNLDGRAGEVKYEKEQIW